MEEEKDVTSSASLKKKKKFSSNLLVPISIRGLILYLKANQTWMLKLHLLTLSKLKYLFSMNEMDLSWGVERRAWLSLLVSRLLEAISSRTRLLVSDSLYLWLLLWQLS